MEKGKKKIKLRLEAVITINYLVEWLRVVLHGITAEKIKNDQEVTAKDHSSRIGEQTTIKQSLSRVVGTGLTNFSQKDCLR